MSGAFTPGPWQVFPYYDGCHWDAANMRCIGKGQYDTLAEVRAGSDDYGTEVDANARLIAAAPMLVEAADDALKAFRLLLRGMPVSAQITEATAELINANIAELEYAINAALGQ